MAMTRAPIARATFTAARPNEPVAGATMIVSPGLSSMSVSPQYGTTSLEKVSLEYSSYAGTIDLESFIRLSVWIESLSQFELAFSFPW